MAVSSIFKIGSTDYSGNVVLGTYKVNQENVYNEWIDGFKVQHRDKCRTRVSGSFDMFFKTQSDYTAFLTSLSSALTASTNCYALMLKVNNIVDNGTLTTYQCFVDIKPTRNVKGDWSDFFEQFTVEVYER